MPAGRRDHGRVSDPLAGMIWHMVGLPDFLSVRAGQPARVWVLTPRPGFLVCGALNREAAKKRDDQHACSLIRFRITPLWSHDKNVIRHGIPGVMNANKEQQHRSGQNRKQGPVWMSASHAG